jgi:multiple sugar transport system permease protein
VPAAWSIALVIFKWNIISPVREFVGLVNFIEAFTSPRVWNAFLVTYRFMGLFVPTVMVFSIALAVIVNGLPRLKHLFAMGFFMPYLASGVAIGLVVQGFVSYNSPLNTVLRRIFGTSPDWLGTPILAVLVISAMMVWKFSGYYSVIFLASLQSIPNDYYEAAALDGATGWQIFRYITFPQLYPALFTVLVLASGVSFNIFTEPFVLTGGGPAMATQTWQLEIYYQAFERFRAGYGATVAVLNAGITFTTIAVIRAVMRKWGARYGYEN